MAQMLANAIKDVAEIMKFENWLRFYFIHEEGETLVIRVPEQSMARIRDLYPQLVELVEEFNNKPVDYESSMSTVCQFVVQKLDGAKYAGGVVPTVFDSPEFQDEMQLFNVWIQSHEAQLDQSFMDFKTWLNLFGEWKNSAEVQEYFQTLKKQAAPMASCNSDAVQ